jgi:hypothetical protein
MESAILLGVFVFFLAGCTNHYMTKQMLLKQVFSQDTLQPTSLPLVVVTPGAVVGMPVRYDSNRLSRVICYNQKGQEVFVSVNKDTQLIVTDKKGVVHKFYLDTLYLQDNMLYGLRSRILHIEKSVLLDEVDKIEIYTELSRERPVTADVTPGSKDEPVAK